MNQIFEESLLIMHIGLKNVSGATIEEQKIIKLILNQVSNISLWNCID